MIVVELERDESRERDARRHRVLLKIGRQRYHLTAMEANRVGLDLRMAARRAMRAKIQEWREKHPDGVVHFGGGRRRK